MRHYLTDMGGEGKTKNRIMLEAAMLFARRGYAAVTVRDIAERVDIRASSLYNHFKSKEALFDAIVDDIRKVNLNGFSHMEEEIRKATSFKEVLNCMFAEVGEVYQIFNCISASLITTEQFRNERANNVFNEVLVRAGIDFSKNKFDECIQKGWVKPFDTEALAILFNNSVLMGMLMRTHEQMEQKTAYDVKEMFSSVRDFILSAVEIIDCRDA